MVNVGGVLAMRIEAGKTLSLLVDDEVWIVWDDLRGDRLDISVPHEDHYGALLQGDGHR